ncbi:histidine phosphatase family protein [Legionella sp.]|uniref:histidine phosphatase family protein n=1 Tax=Legionella sp. TaxID=459 RepID=UPI003CC2A88F
MTTRLIIARHGNTFAPSDRVRRVGLTDLPLVASGLLQGNCLGSALKQKNLIPDVIFASKLKRTIQTADQAQKAMGTKLCIKTLAIFNEIDYGPDENQPEEHVIVRLGKEALHAWEARATVPNGWNVKPAEIINNWIVFSQHLRQHYAGKTCLVVTSNGIARFAPHLTGDFAAFSTQHNIKIATGAYCLFENEPFNETWNCRLWNVKLAKTE